MSFIRNRTFEHSPIALGYSDLTTDTTKKGRTYVTPEGNKYPSITTVLSLRGKADIQAWRARVGEEEANRISRHACTRGNAVHSLAERYLNNEETVLSGAEMPHVLLSFKAAQKILDQSVGAIVMQECPLYSDYLKLAGRVDLVAEFDGLLSIVDFKTSTRVKTAEDIPNYFIQESAYAIMFEERTGVPITSLVTIMVVDGRAEPIVFKQHRDKWAPELIQVIEEYDRAKLFGHI